MYVPDIRAAKEWRQRPTAVIMKDRWFGHRTHKGEKVGDPDELTRWDYALISALQIIEDSSDRNGLLHWQTDADWVDVEAVKKINKFDAVVARATSGKKYKPAHGEYFVPRLKSRSKELGIPTFQEYQETRRKELEEEREKTDGTIDG